MLKAVQAFCSIPKADVAIPDIISQLNEQLGVYRPQAGILCSSFYQDNQLLTRICSELTRYFHGLTLIGSSVIAGATDEQGYQKQGIFVQLMVSDDLHFSTGVVEHLVEQQQQQFPQGLHSVFSDCHADEPAICLVYPSYYQVDGVQLMEELSAAAPSGCRIFGGFATDYFSQEMVADPEGQDFPIENSWQLISTNGETTIYADAMVYLIIRGELDFQFSYSLGWSDDQKLYSIKTDGCTINAVEGNDPVAFLSMKRHPLISSAEGMLEYPFWIHEEGKEPYLRDFAFNEDKQLEALGSPVPEGARISFSFPQHHKILREHREAINRLDDHFDVGFCFACASRVMTLGEKIHKEADFVRLVLDKSPVLSGYFFGEFFPIDRKTDSVLHSCSSVTLLIRSRSELDKKRGNGRAAIRFLDQRLQARNREIEELKQQLAYFEKQGLHKENLFWREIVGLLMARSMKSVSSYAEDFQQSMKAYYGDEKPPFPISRNRIIERIQPLKVEALKKYKK